MASTSGTIRSIDLKATFAERPPAIDFVLPGLALGTMGTIVSPGGTGKSMLLLASVLSVGLGEDLGEIWGTDPTPGPAVYIGLEDPVEILTLRLHDLGQQMHLTSSQIERAAATCHFLPAYGRGWTVATRTPAGVFESERFGATVERLAELRPRLIVIDTLNRALGGADENSNGDMGLVMSFMERMCRVTGAAGLAAHHANKASMRDGSGSDQHAARGASAVTDNVRWQANLQTMTPDDAAARGITDDLIRRKFVKLDVPKVNYGPPQGSRWLERLEGGVLAAGSPPPRTAKGASKGSKPSKPYTEVDDNDIPW